MGPGTGCAFIGRAPVPEASVYTTATIALNTSPIAQMIIVTFEI